MLMNSWGRPPIQRGGPLLGTKCMDLAVCFHEVKDIRSLPKYYSNDLNSMYEIHFGHKKMYKVSKAKKSCYRHFCHYDFTNTKWKKFC